MIRHLTKPETVDRSQDARTKGCDPIACRIDRTLITRCRVNVCECVRGKRRTTGLAKINKFHATAIAAHQDVVAAHEDGVQPRESCVPQTERNSSRNWDCAAVPVVLPERRLGSTNCSELNLN